MKGLFDKTFWGLTIGLIALLILNFFLADWLRGIGLQSIARGMVALGLLVLWRTGLISFGHALFFGFGAYAAALLQRIGINDFFVILIVGTAASGLLAYGLGFLLRQYRAIYFALLNLAFSMILWGVLANLEVLGSTDGIGVRPPSYLGIELEGEANQMVLFALAIIFTYLVAVATNLYLRSTLGYMTMAVRENEIRVEYLGYSAERAIHMKYIISGLVAGFGGVVMAFAVGHVDPDSMAYWPISGDFVFITILSGSGNVAAPLIGAMVYELIRSYAFEYAPQVWQLIMGGSLLLIIMFLPDGLWSLTERFKRDKA
ncbi:MAG: branched-chain amino acid ABC transporter permease [Pseudomonadota bacterium]|nr:branched-chain amino acid ABC transporter permease [Pseudomonadota bacterium]